MLFHIVAGQVFSLSQVILTIEKIVSIPAKPKVKSKIIDLITGCIDDVNSLSAYQETCAVMYLTLDSNEDDPEGVSKFQPGLSKTFRSWKKAKYFHFFLHTLLCSPETPLYSIPFSFPSSSRPSLSFRSFFLVSLLPTWELRAFRLPFWRCRYLATSFFEPSFKHSV